MFEHMESEQSSPGDRALSSNSLRVRLPLYFGVLLIVMLGSFLWAAHEEVETASRQAGHDRAGAAARQIANMLAGSVSSMTEELEEVAAEPALRAHLRDPDTGSREEARRLLEPFADLPFRRIEAWSADGSLLLDVEGAISADSLPAPAGGPPTEAGVGDLRPLGSDASSYDVVVEVRDGPGPNAPLLGHLRRSARMSSGSADAVRGLVGSGASLRVGTMEGGLWSNLSTNVDPPPLASLTDGGAEEDPTAAGAGDRGEARWTGAVAPVAGTPWLVWVGFPAAVVAAPAQAFLGRMISLALLFIAGGAALAALLGVRLTRPLHELARGAEKIAAGDYSRRVRTGRADEIGRLAVAFNTMIDRIEDAHGALRESHEQTHFALAAARIGVWESDLEADRMTCSESMELVLGLPEDLLPCTRGDFLERVYPADRESVRRVLEGRGTEDGVFDFEFRAVDVEGSIRWIEGKGRKKLDAGGRPISVLAVVGDVTERRRLESQLRQAQKMEAIGQLAGGVAHDFNNLLTSIVGHGSLVLDGLDEGDQAREDVIEILKAGESGARLTRQLLAFSRRQVMQPEVVSVASVVRSTEKLLRRLIGEDIEFATEIAPALDDVKVDPGFLEQVLMNLVVNARDAMPGGGRLTIAARNVRLIETFAGDHGSAPPGDYVVITVIDTGTGMDDETRIHLFEPFFTTKGPGKGTGLGLATVFGIVKQSGGHIFVHSEAGHGTSFEIYLPAERMGDSSRRPDASPDATVRHGAPRTAEG